MSTNLPAIIYHVYLPHSRDPWAGDLDAPEFGSIWEFSRFHIEPYEVTYNKLVRVLPPPTPSFAR